jgi:hypothetical protein
MLNLMTGGCYVLYDTSLLIQRYFIFLQENLTEVHYLLKRELCRVYFLL